VLKTSGETRLIKLGSLLAWHVCKWHCDVAVRASIMRATGSRGTPALLASVTGKSRCDVLRQCRLEDMHGHMTRTRAHKTCIALR
jgi:hypothetical protein